MAGCSGSVVVITLFDTLIFGDYRALLEGLLLSNDGVRARCFQALSCYAGFFKSEFEL